MNLAIEFLGVLGFGGGVLYLGYVVTFVLSISAAKLVDLKTQNG